MRRENGLVENVAIVMVGFAVVALFVITFLAHLLLRLGIAYLLAAACSSVVFLDPSLTQWGSAWAWFWIILWLVILG